MNEPPAPPPVTLSPRRLQTRFLLILAKIQSPCAAFLFRLVWCSCKGEDFVAETIALAWKWFRRLAEKGKDARPPRLLCREDTRLQHAGRQPAERSAVRDTRPRSRPARRFRCDLPAWLARLGRRNRKIAVEMAQSEKTQALARRFQISPGRVSQLRREFHEDWLRFCDELPSRN